MEPDRAELRTELLAMLHAAPELPPDDRASLADVFLDHLQAGYDVVPRARTDNVRAPRRERTLIQYPDLSRVVARFAAVLLVMTVLWMTVFTSGDTHWHHPSLFPLLIVFFVAMRVLHGRPGGRRRYSAR